MPRVNGMTPIGILFRERRQAHKVSWDRLKRKVKASDEAMQKWERGETKDPPLTKALLFAREVGISLEELAEAALGEPWQQPESPQEPASSVAGNGRGTPPVVPDIAASADARLARRAPAGQQTQRPSRDQKPSG